MRLLSIDVGIKNLAHCLFERVDGKLNILDWKIVDLTPQLFCQHCKKRATIVCGDQCFCKKHDPSTKDPAAALVSLKQQCEEKGLPTKGTASALRKRLGVKTTKVAGANQIPDTQLAQALIGAYDACFRSLHIDRVAIENQMAPRLKPLQGMLILYWTQRGATVDVVSPSNKLRALGLNDTTYAERKRLSVARSRELLEKYSLDAGVLERQKKKDDLADAFLQGVWYLEEKLRTT